LSSPAKILKPFRPSPLPSRRDYAPANTIEEVLVADMARHHWLKDRAMHLQDEGLAKVAAGELPPESMSEDNWVKF